MKKALISTILTLAFPGAAQIYYGYYLLGSLILLGGMGLQLAEAEYAYLGPWVLVAALFVNLLLLVTVGLHAFRAPDKHNSRWMGLALIIALVVAMSTLAPVDRFRRVSTFAQPSDAMAPTILNGEAFAVDQRPTTPYQERDLVAVQHGIRTSTWVRRIQKIEGSKVTLMADNPQFQEPVEVDLSFLRGKLLYVYYSMDPQTHRPRFERFFKRLE